MTRKNTILIAVLINAGLIAVLLIAALTTQEDLVPASTVIGDASQLDDKPLFGDLDLAKNESFAPVQGTLSESAKPVEIPIAVMDEPLTHKLPPLVPESAPIAVAPAPVATAPAPVAAAPAPVAAAPHTPSSLLARAPIAEVIVKKGDNLEKIAKTHHTTVDEIIKLNRLPSSFLKVGQILKVQAERSLANVPKPAEKKAVESQPEYYTMKVGDNPWAIAMKHHLKVEELLRLNGLNEERARKLKPGDRLRIK